MIVRSCFDFAEYEHYTIVKLLWLLSFLSPSPSLSSLKAMAQVIDVEVDEDDDMEDDDMEDEPVREER